MNKKIIRIFCVLLIICQLFSGFVFAQAIDEVSAIQSQSIEDGGSYSAYIQKYAEISPSKEVISLQLFSSMQSGIEECELDGKKAVVIREENSVTYEFEVQNEGLFEIYLTYYNLPGKGIPIEFSLSVDGAFPFSDIQNNILRRVYKDITAVGEVKDLANNDLIPKQEEVSMWQQTALADTTGVSTTPYQLFFEKGKHTLTFQANRGDLAFAEIVLKGSDELPTYDELQKEYQEKNYKKVDLKSPVICEAEKPTYKSETTIYSTFDKTSPLTTPYSCSKIRLNAIGAKGWSEQGQWLEWEIEAPENGLYRICLRAKQNTLSGSFVTRKMYVNGTIPCKELADIRLNYDMAWQNVELPYDIYLNEGKNTIRLECSVGALDEIIAQVEEGMKQLNTAYREIIMVTGVTPDTYRDYKLEKTAAHALEIFEEQVTTFKDCDEKLYTLTGKRGSMNGILQTVTVMLEEFNAKTYKIPTKISALKDNIGALGTWLISIKKQSLTIDKIYIYSVEEQLPKSEAGFIRRIIHEIKCFLASFTEDYTTIGIETDSDKQIEVWVQAGRDQANIINNLIINDFTPQTGIYVNVKLVQGQLLPATVAGKGPDVALQTPQTEPVNYALRQAAIDLTQFDTYNEVAKRFRSSALEPFKFEEGVYALPETQIFPMMFVRTDIMEDLSLEIPQNWGEFFSVTGKLQKKNLTVGVSTDMYSMAMFLYQNGGSFYIEGNTKSGLQTDKAVDAFRTWSSLYTDYKLPFSYDALNRFRTGEMPIIIDNYSLYNTLFIGAPEIKGVWQMVPVPATIDEEGNEHREVASTVTASMMLAKKEKQEYAWDFLDWWSTAEIQGEFGKQIENQLGVSARYCTANVEAFSNLPWTKKEYEILSQQWDQVKAIPEVAGGYFTGRHLNNALRRVINLKENPKDTLLDYVLKIDEEIKFKRKELKLD